MSFSDEIKKSNTDEWYTTPKDVEIIVPFLEKKGYKKILCPFDTSNSQYVRVLRARGFDVDYGHIWTGEDFFEIKNFTQWDAVVSNPPFSKREAILKKLFKEGVPFALILNWNGLFDSKTRWTLFKENQFELLIPQGRMRFFNGESVLNSPNFQSVYVCHAMTEKTIEFIEREEHD